MIVAGCECLLLLTLLFTYFGPELRGRSDAFHRGDDPVCLLRILVRHSDRRGDSQSGGRHAGRFAMGGFLLVFMLSGLIFPIQNIPAQIRWISNFIWGRYYIDTVRDALLQGGGWPAVWWKVLIIGVTGLIFYAMAWRSMRRMQLKA
jgi:hypothetical protein